MKIQLSVPCQLSSHQVERWKNLTGSDHRLQHPQLSYPWAAILESAGWPVEVACLEADGNHGFFCFARRTSQNAHPIGGLFSDRQAIISPLGMKVDPMELLRGCRLKSFSFDHWPAGDETSSRHQHCSDTAYEVRFHHSFSAYENELSCHHRGWHQHLLRKRRKLIREVGPLRFELHTECDFVIQALIQWKSQQVESARSQALFTSEVSHRLLKATIFSRFDGFSGWLSALYAGSQLVAAHLGQRYGSQLNAWIPAYNPDFAAYSPGTLLHMELLRHCLDEGVTEIDLGRGANQLKTSLSNHRSELALGVIDLRPWSHWLWVTQFKTKQWLIRSGGKERLERLYRYFRHNRPSG